RGCVGAGGVPGDHAVEAGDLEDLHDLLVSARDRHRAASGLVEPFDRACEHADGSRVDEGDVGEVQDKPAAAVSDRAHDARLELWADLEVDLAADYEHRNVGS